MDRMQAANSPTTQAFRTRRPNLRYQTSQSRNHLALRPSSSGLYSAWWSFSSCLARVSVSLKTSKEQIIDKMIIVMEEMITMTIAAMSTEPKTTLVSEVTAMSSKLTAQITTNRRSDRDWRKQKTLANIRWANLSHNRERRALSLLQVANLSLVIFKPIVDRARGVRRLNTSI